ncbi:EmrB/QacA subfamily drug resistance transporter [Pseudonocardia hierapolitana]|uniref:EmrB/QacA subfamily drug resistance transporter n=1 Tax=Pseudonocardia hierapolitana TaxID=1128676 RepID=A0A561SNN6_9PSEU|nr:MFS transporter [Pseudonocardia hierapolitana]TWF76477.1 EmrB/QacA subfamily drug resistance transporter [Pseudonocardia hierapolitana]
MVPPPARSTDRSALDPPRLRYAPVLVLTLMQVTLVIDNSVVNVALPVIQDELGFSSAGLSWVVTSYALAFGGLVLLSGRVGSIIGPRRALLIGVSVFVAASALGGLAATPGTLIAARVLQGVGAALAAPSTLVLLMAITQPGVQRARAMSLFVLSIGLGAGLGLTLGGALTSGLGWEWVMFVNVPIGALVFFGVRALVPEADRHPGRLDVGGAAASTIGMLALVHGLTAAADQGWASTSVIASFVLAGAGLLALVLAERRHGAPVVPLTFFTSMSSAAPLLAMMLIPAGQFGFLYFAALYTQGVLGFSPLQTGLSVLPFTAGMLTTNFTVSRLVTRYGERVVGSAGMIGLLTGLVWMSRLTPASGYLDGLLGPFLLLGLGAGLTVAPLTAVIMHNAPREHVGAASSLNQAMQQLGGAAGLAVLSTVFAGTAGGSGTATDISTALTVATAFPLLALLLFAVWARPTAAR